MPVAGSPQGNTRHHTVSGLVLLHLRYACVQLLTQATVVSHCCCAMSRPDLVIGMAALQASVHAGLDSARTPQEVKQCIRQNFQDLGTFSKQHCSVCAGSHDNCSLMSLSYSLGSFELYVGRWFETLTQGSFCDLAFSVNINFVNMPVTPSPTLFTGT